MTRQKSTQPSISDVARLAGVSLGTVSNVLNSPERVKEDTAARVQRAIASLGFVRNDAARQLKAGKSSAIGLVVLDTTNPFFADLARGAEDSAIGKGLQVLIGNSDHQKSREASHLKIFQEQRLSGVLLSPVENAANEVRALRDVGTQVVILDQKTSKEFCCSVSVDDVAGGEMAVQHLIEQGKRKIAFVGGSLDIHQVADRLTGATMAKEKAEQEITLETFRAKSQDVISGRLIGNEILGLPESRRPDGVFAANDLLAVGLLQAFALDNRISIPGDIALIGYDDIDFAATAVVPLSSIKQPAKLIGSTGLELLVDEIDNAKSHQHRQVTFQPELIVRASTVASLAY
mgnify:CR=1 FL=1|jgi:LacI family transcriptional regulator